MIMYLNVKNETPAPHNTEMKRRKINKNVIAPGVQILYINELRQEVRNER